MTTPEEGAATFPGAPGEDPEGEVTAGGCLVLVAFVALAAGLLALAVGGFFAHAGPSAQDPDNVRCGDDIMERGDTCLAFGGGPDEGGSYDEVADQQRRKARTHRISHQRSSTAFRTGGALVAVALGLYVIGFVALKREERRRPPS